MAGQKRVYDAIYAAKNGPAGEFDAAKYQQIIENVEGGPIGVVNGAKTIMPQGVTHGEFEASLTSLDYNAVSLFQKPPVAWNDHHDALVPIQDWAKQLLQPIRAEPGLYMFMNDKGEFLSVADPQSPTGVRAYVARLDAATIKTAAARSQTNIDVLGSRGARAPAVPSSLGAGVGPAAAFDPNAFPDPAVERSLALPEPVHVPKEHRLNMEKSVDAYKRALANSGRSKEYVDQAGKDFMDNLMNVYRQGHGGSQR
jgi:hypothetical protein